MRSTFLAALVVAVLSACAAVDSAPQDEAGLSDQARAERIRTRAEPHRERVRAGARASAGELWGSYGHSNGFENLHLDLGPEGFYFAYTHCTGIGEIAYGSIASVEDTLVRLVIVEHAIVGGPRVQNGTRRRQFRFDDELYAIPWSGERFLVTPELVPEFCMLAKGEGYDSMRFADYPRRLEPGESAWGRALPLDGLPEVPVEFLSYLPR